MFQILIIICRFLQIVAMCLHSLLHRQPQQRDTQVSKLQKFPRPLQGGTLNDQTHNEPNNKSIFLNVKKGLSILLAFFSLSVFIPKFRLQSSPCCSGKERVYVDQLYNFCISCEPQIQVLWKNVSFSVLADYETFPQR